MSKVKNIDIIPILKYNSIEDSKGVIYKKNKGKSGIYRWIHKGSGKSYIGSSVSLNRRFNVYFSYKALVSRKTKSNSKIYSALLKYGLSNFSLEILEYCKKESLIDREQYYLDLLKPEYNILKIAGSSLGFKHSETIKLRMSVYNKGKRHSIETRTKISESLKLVDRVKGKSRIVTEETRVKLSKGVQGICIKVFDKSGKLVNEFPTISKCAKCFNVSNKTMSKILYKNEIFYGCKFKYEIKDLRVWIYNIEKKLLIVLNNKLKASLWCNVPYSTFTRYIKSGKLYKNKFYFYTKEI